MVVSKKSPGRPRTRPQTRAAHKKKHPEPRVPINGPRLATAMEMARLERGLSRREVARAVQQQTSVRGGTSKNLDVLVAKRGEAMCLAPIRAALATVLGVSESWLSGERAVEGRSPLFSIMDVHPKLATNDAVLRPILLALLARQRFAEAIAPVARAPAVATMLERLTDPTFWTSLLLEGDAAEAWGTEVRVAAERGGRSLQGLLAARAEAVRGLAAGFTFVLRPWLEGTATLAVERLAALEAMVAGLGTLSRKEAP